MDGGFTLDEFTVDEAAGTVTCPNGLTARSPAPARRSSVRAAETARCGPAAPPRAAGGRCGCIRTTRCSARTGPAPRIPEFQAVYRQHRPMVERSISWLVAGRNRRLRFLGTRLNDLWLHHRVAALNLRRLLTLGLTRSGGTWALAPA